MGQCYENLETEYFRGQLYKFLDGKQFCHVNPKGETVVNPYNFSFENNSLIFHSGTREENNKYFTNGGRVLSVTSSGDSLKQSINNSYAALDHIRFDGMHYRKDIGQKGLDHISDGKLQ